MKKFILLVMAVAACAAMLYAADVSSLTSPTAIPNMNEEDLITAIRTNMNDQLTAFATAINAGIDAVNDSVWESGTNRLLLAYGTCTNGQTVTFSQAFRGAANVAVICDSTNAATSVTSTNFVGVGTTTAWKWIAVGLR